MNALLPTKQYTFCINEKNKIFDRKYNLTDDQRRDILKSLTVDDCIKVEPNNNERYPDDEIYVFLKLCTVDVYGEDDLINLYIKLYIHTISSFEQVIVISFHKEGMY